MRAELVAIRAMFEGPMRAITHDPEDVSVLAQTVVVLNQGGVEKVVDVMATPTGMERGVWMKDRFASC